MPTKKVRPNVLRLPKDVSSESIQKAHAVVQAFTKNLRALGSLEAAAAKTAAETKTRAETRKK